MDEDDLSPHLSEPQDPTIHHNKKPYVCPLCKNQFRNSSDLKRHERIHTERKLLECSFANCSFRTHRRDSLVLHEKTHSGIESRLVHPCPSCAKTFSSEQIATRHSKTCGKAKQARKVPPVRETRCHHCGKEFSSVYKLATHRKTHDGRLEFECTACGKCFASKAALNKHRLSHEKSFQCELCEKLFSRKDNLTAHFQTHFKSDKAGSRQGGGLLVEYICSFCQGTMASREALMEHFEKDPLCSRHCHEHLCREAEVVREEVVEYDGEATVEEEERQVKTDTEIILVDQGIQEQDILIIEEPVVYC